MESPPSRPGLLQLQSEATLQSPRRRALSTLLVVFLASTLVLIAPRPAEAADFVGFGGNFWGNSPATMAPSQTAFLRGITPGSAAAAQARMAAAAAAAGGGTTAAASATGAAVAAAPYAVAAGVGILVGWGIVESGLWDWATGSDPVPATTVVVWASPHATFEYTHNVDNYRFYYSMTSTVATGSTGITGRNWCDGRQVQTGGSFIIGANEPEGTTVTGYRDLCGPDVIQWSTSLDGTTFVDAEQTSQTTPDRTVTTTADCIGPGDVITTVTATSDPYAPGDEVRNPGVECPAGTVVGDVSVVRGVDGQPGVEEELFATDHVTDTYPDLGDPDLNACLDGSCTLMIYETQPDGTNRSCELATVVCTGWADVSEPTRSDTYECLWGTNVMPLSDCEMYWEIDAESYVGADPGVDSDLSTTTDRDVAPTETITTTPDPDSGCDSGSWLNPFTKMAAAVACALEWAFVPEAGTVTQTMTQLQTEATQTEPISTVIAWTGWVADFGDVGTGCLDLHFTIKGEPLRVIDSCEPDPGSAWLIANRGIITVIMWAAFLVPLSWWLWERYFPGSQGMA